MSTYRKRTVKGNGIISAASAAIASAAAASAAAASVSAAAGAAAAGAAAGGRFNGSGLIKEVENKVDHAKS